MFFHIRKLVKTLLYTIVHRLFSQDFSQLLESYSYCAVFVTIDWFDRHLLEVKLKRIVTSQLPPVREYILFSQSYFHCVFLNRIISVKSVITHRFLR